jgi:predicted transcriptional regulator of viral defense system
MEYPEVLRKFREKKIGFFSFREFQILTGLSYRAARGALYRYKKKGWVVSPKKGYYYFSEYPLHDFELANKLYSPSYLSMETVLSKEGIIPEAVYSITSVTPKPTRLFTVEGKIFRYSKIKPQAFAGYYKEDGYLIAEPEKAVVDYLYFVALGRKALNERMDLARLRRKKILEYARLFANKRLIQLIEQM